MRVETDLIGTKEIEKDAYYGLQTLRAYENFNITGRRVHPEFIRSLAAVKKAAAITNCQTGELSEERKNAIVQACDEILAGKLHDASVPSRIWASKMSIIPLSIPTTTSICPSPPTT